MGKNQKIKRVSLVTTERIMCMYVCIHIHTHGNIYADIHVYRADTHTHGQTLNMVTFNVAAECFIFY